MTAAAGVEQSLSQSWLVSSALLVEVKVDEESSHPLLPPWSFSFPLPLTLVSWSLQSLWLNSRDSHTQGSSPFYHLLSFVFSCTWFLACTFDRLRICLCSPGWHGSQSSCLSLQSAETTGMSPPPANLCFGKHPLSLGFHSPSCLLSCSSL